jgi:hypothetical protein
MALADFTPQREPVTFQGGSFSVRGLSLEDVSRLIRTHYADLETLLTLYDDQAVDVFSRRGLDKFVLKLCQDAPQFVASIVLLASDEEGELAEAAVRRLPLPVLVDALVKIGNLTFQEAGSLKKFVGALGTLLGGLVPPETMARLRAAPGLKAVA